MITNHKNCSVCGKNLPISPLLMYVEMPSGAQAFPSHDKLVEDKGMTLTIFQCPSCGLVQLGGEPVPYYKDVIRATAFSQEMCEFRKKQFSEFIGKNQLKGKKVVEIGCGRGEYLRLLNEAGADGYGVEHNFESVKACLASGLKVQQFFVENENDIIQGGPFDGFMILNFLEHLPSPVKTLRGIANNLSENGIGLIEVPNLDMIIQENLFTEFISDHILYFTRETLCQILSISGFEVLECKAIWHDYILSAIVRKRVRLDISGFNKQREKLTNELNSFINKFPEKTVAIWGAGHQALATISLTGIAEKIKYVIDSAPFKQGKFTPASHIPIVAPKMIEIDKPSAIIVMAAGYSNEVVEIIKKDYSSDIALAVLKTNKLELV